MTRYLCAIVRFSPGGRAYPVNNRNGFNAGSRVIVRFVGQGGRLQAAEVVERIYCRRACRNSIVAEEARAAEYGGGPAAIDELDELIKFLRHLGWQHVETSGALATDWPTVYEEPQFYGLPNRYPRRVYIGPTRFSSIMEGGKLLTFHAVGRSSYEPDPSNPFDSEWLAERAVRFRFDRATGKNVYRQAAEWAEGDLAWIADEGEDRSVGEIRGAISGRRGGRAYLSDDVWL